MAATIRARTGASRIGADGLTRFFATVGLAVVFPYLVLIQAPDGGRNAVWVACLVIAVWAGVRLAGLIAAGVPRLFELSFWLFTYLFLGIGPAAQIHADEMARTTPGLDPARDGATFVVIAVGVVAFDVGMLVRRSMRADDAPAAAADDTVAAARSSVSRGLWLLAIVAPVAFGFVAVAGPANFFTSRIEFSEAVGATFDSTILPVLRAIAWVPALVVLHRIISRRRLERGSTLTGPELVGGAAASLLLLIANNPLSSSRYAFGSMALSLAVLLGACATPQRARRMMLVIVVGFVVVFPLADTFRRAEPGAVEVAPFDEYSGNPDYDSFGQISNAITVVDQEGFSYLRQPLGVALFWVPRSVWEDKPIDTSVYLARQRGYAFENLSAPLWSELYLVGGHLAVGAGFGALGYVVAMGDDRLVRSLSGRRRYSVAGAFMPFYLIIVLRGSLLQAAALAAALAAAIWLTRPHAADDEAPDLVGAERLRSSLP